MRMTTLLTALVAAAFSAPVGAQVARMNAGLWCYGNAPSASICHGVQADASGAYAAANHQLLNDILAELRALNAKQTEAIAALRSTDSTTKATQAEFRTQVVEFNGLIRETITARFNQLPAVLTQDPRFKAALDGLRSDILQEVERRAKAAGQATGGPPGDAKP